jgi:predicted AlkP superfamily pyrophosphatase or phosphodiesterase
MTRSRSGSLALVLFVLAALSLPCSGSAAETATKKHTARYILFLTSDGFRTDYVEWYHPTNLEKLIAEGVRVKHARNVFPTVTTPNMTSLVTGAYPKTTGIACNSQYVKEEDRIVEHPRQNKAETIAETLHRAGWKTGAANHFMLSNKWTDFYVAPGYDESEKTTDAVLDMLKNKGAQFIGAIYGAPDHAGHNHGPSSEAVKQAVTSVDAAVGRLIAGLKDMGIYEDTLITFNADHGMSGYEDKQVSIEPANALREAGFKVAKSQKELTSETQIIVINAGGRLIYFRKGVSETERQKALQVLSSIRGAEVLDRKRLDELGCHNNRSGDLIVNPLPGYTMSRAGQPGGQHGRFAEQNPILFFRGPGFKKGATVESANTVDVVPTLLKLVGIEPAKSVDGKVTTEVLE